jgi:DnaJ-class molecular chaperone
MQDLYAVLGVSERAGEDEIKHAFRSAAKRFHPDTPEGAKDKGRRFQSISAAYEILGDPAKRRQYDLGEIDANGEPRPKRADGPRTRADAWSKPAAAHANGPANGSGKEKEKQSASRLDAFRWAFEKAFGMQPNMDTRRKRRVEDLFAEFFGERQKGEKRGSARKGVDTHYDLTITFEEAVLGGTRRVKMPNGKRFDVKIPVGVNDGQIIRLKGLGEPGLAGGTDGDALVQIKIDRHPYYRREGRDIRLELPVTLTEAMLGAKIKVPTLYGPVTLSIPENSNTGTVFRLKGKGLPQQGLADAGDLLVGLAVRLPDKSTGPLADAVRKWESSNPYYPRKDIE